MTIIASVKVYDGIILGADSATQIMGQDANGNNVVLKTYQNAKKLFQYRDRPVGLLTYGIGNIGKKSIETLLREYDLQNTVAVSPNSDVEGISRDLLTFFSNAYNQFYGHITDESKKPILGFYIAGYSPILALGEEWEFIIPRDTEPKKVRERELFGSSWRGISIPFTRLYFGYDPRVLNDLISLGIPEPQLRQIFSKYQASVIYDGMPVKDAVEFVKFILKTTIGLSSFETGAVSCSEPILIASITPKEGFQYL
jgi:hypothetical protein